MGQNEKSPAYAFPWKETLGFLGVVLVAYIGYLGMRSQAEIPIQATQTAEAKLAISTFPPSTTTMMVPEMQETEQPVSISISTETTSLNPTQTNTFVPITPAIDNQYSLRVPANVYWNNTNIAVQQGQQLEFIAKGQWGNGISITGPDGDYNHDCDQRYIICAEFGALVGALGTLNSDKQSLNAAAFLIGNSSTLIAGSDGILFLAMNENIGACQSGIEGSCFDDNFYALEVTVKLR